MARRGVERDRAREHALARRRAAPLPRVQLRLHVGGEASGASHDGEAMMFRYGHAGTATHAHASSPHASFGGAGAEGATGGRCGGAGVGGSALSHGIGSTTSGRSVCQSSSAALSARFSSVSHVLSP